MKPLDLVTPRTLEGALAALASPDAVPLAGGTDLIGVLKDELHAEQPKTLVNLKSIPELRGIDSRSDGSLRLGPLTTLSRIATDSAVVERFPLLASAAHSVGSRQLRNMGTLGGNLCQEARCWYYRYPKGIGGPIPCLRKGDKGCPAVGGDHRNHSLFGGEGCFAASPSDLATALLALDATFILEKSGGKRIVRAADFHTPLGTALAQEELLTSVEIPAPPAGAVQRYLKFTQRHPIDFALAAVACVLTVEGGVVTGASLALGGVAPTPLRASEAEKALVGKSLDAVAATEAAALAVKNARPLKGNAHRVKILATLVERAIGGEEPARCEEWGGAECEETGGGKVFRWDAAPHTCAGAGA